MSPRTSLTRYLIEQQRVHGSIPPELRRRVFTKFWTGGVRGGSGLGMYLVNGLTRAHGGSITLGDAESGGARVVIEWPAAEVLG